MEKRKTNLEAYGKEILEYLGKYGAIDFGVNKKTRELENCKSYEDGALSCCNCIFTDDYLCSFERQEWFYKTYKDPRVMELEKAILTILKKGYLVRDEYDEIVFSLGEPEADFEEMWTEDENGDEVPDDVLIWRSEDFQNISKILLYLDVKEFYQIFEYIKREPTEIYSVEELLAKMEEKI